MQIKVPPTSPANLLDAREGRLTAFVTSGIEAAATAGGAAVLAVARCGESPVARTLMAMRSALVTHGAKLRLVLAEEDALIDQFLAPAAEGETMSVEVRIVRNPRLRDAHEQLVIGGVSAWFGDSLRRDVTRRDLFEQFHEQAPEVAIAAARTFERLWARTEPALSLAALATDSLTALAGRTPGNTGPSGTALC